MVLVDCLSMQVAGTHDRTLKAGCWNARPIVEGCLLECWMFGHLVVAIIEVTALEERKREADHRSEGIEVSSLDPIVLGFEGVFL